ncbi:MAG: MerR family transcriptional regulator [Bacteroidales bacterium]|nr:MerR family transcriptional regulator [Bacteroidales bacterium]
MNMAQYSIKDLEHLTGIKAHTIRIWEKRYRILNPKRTTTNIRYYDDDDVRRIINISILNDKGFKISHISEFSETEIQEKVEFLTMDAGEFKTQIETLVLAMIKMDELRFYDILSKAIMAQGFEKAFLNIVFPFLQRIGLLWLTGAINPGQEHFISNLIRQKLITNIDAQNHPPTDRSKRFILFLPEGELHELSLLFLSFLIKKRGHELMYLGQFTPLNSVIETDQIWHSDIIVTALITGVSGVAPEEYAGKMSRAFPDKKLIITGQMSKEIPDAKYNNVLCFPKNTGLINFLDNLT